jgi:LPPG:FO 2-phospho-L-lactate transferase
MTDDAVRTRFDTDGGELSFPEYFVRERLRLRLRGIRFAGIETARATREVGEALAAADLVVIGPSNPLISIAPILQLVRSNLSRERTLAVTPIVGGLALKGPTVEMMRALGPEPNPVEVARLYRDIAGGFVLDERDRDLRAAIEEIGYKTIVRDTVMRDGGRELARAVLSYV